MKKKKKKVIDLKNEYKEQESFGVGHSQSQSMTFMPQFKVDSNNPDVVWADIAGLQDTGGELISFINSFVNKKIFQLAKEVKFLVPLTSQQLSDARGKGVREQIQVIQEISRNADQTEVIKSILPILTKVRQNELFDIDERRQTISHLLLKELENRKVQDTLLSQNADGDPDLLSEQEKAKEYYQKQEDFYHSFASKFELYDPLDRATPSGND